MLLSLGKSALTFFAAGAFACPGSRNGSTSPHWISTGDLHVLVVQKHIMSSSLNETVIKESLMNDVMDLNSCMLAPFSSGERRSALYLLA
eukprot:scaffold2332_cov50-Attheya_sp.AAC.2